jgi:hypothetical protein
LPKGFTLPKYAKLIQERASEVNHIYQY